MHIFFKKIDSLSLNFIQYFVINLVIIDYVPSSLAIYLKQRGAISGEVEDHIDSWNITLENCTLLGGHVQNQKVSCPDGKT